MSGMLSRSDLMGMAGIPAEEAEDRFFRNISFLKLSLLKSRCDAKWVSLYGEKDLDLVVDENRVLGWALIAELNWRIRHGLA